MYRRYDHLVRARRGAAAVQHAGPVLQVDALRATRTVHTMPVTVGVSR
jgi:hypothetical protein